MNDNETVVVTGSSRGIGRALAKRFAQNQDDVVVCAPPQEQENIDEVVNEINSTDNWGSAIGLTFDVTDRELIRALKERTVSEFDTIDVLVNNAGGGHACAFEELSYEKWSDIIDLNLHGTFNCTQIIGEHFRKSEEGCVINLASPSGIHGNVNQTPYSAAKAAIVNLTRTLAFEWAEYDIRVNAIAPGQITTERLRKEMDIHLPNPDEINRSNVARRIGRPDEIADVALFLASDAASFITGETIMAAGVPRLERVLEVYDYDPDGSAWIEFD